MWAQMLVTLWGGLIMRSFARLIIVATCLVLLPVAASAQTSTIAGQVKDSSGALLPGVTVEVASPALIERVRSTTTDGSGQYKIIELRPGVYTVTFTLPGFSTLKRERIELTSDFTATVDAELKVGAVEETITVLAQSPVVDVQGITSSTVMTRDVMDALPTGRNIQAVGIMIPGTALTVGGGGALSRDVGGSGGMQQSPLNYRGSADTVQTIEGMRLNNLCGNGAYSGVYWDDGSFTEYSYVTGADSAEMGQGGIRVNLVPKDGGNTFRGTVLGNYTHGPWQGSNYSASDLSGDTTFSPNNRLANISVIKQIWDFNPSFGGPIKHDKLWFNGTFRYWGTNKTVPGSFPNLLNSPFQYAPDLSNPGVDDGHIFSYAGRVAWQLNEKDKITAYHDLQNKYRGHWGIASNVPPEASALEVTPTNFVTVEKWTRTQSNRLLFDAGFAMYDQEYTEIYQPSVTGSTAQVYDPAAIAASHVYTILDQNTNQYASAWNNPADHFSKLITESGSASYVTGSHAFKFGGTVTEGRWRQLQNYTGNVEPITYNAGTPVSVTLRLPTDRRNGIKADTGLYAQDRWTIRRATINAGLRFDWFIGESLPESLPASALAPAITFPACSNGLNSLANGCTGTVENWKDVSPRVGIAYDLFGNGKTALKTSIARYVNGEQIGTANSTNPETTIGITDTRAWKDLDGNGLPFDANGNLQLNELSPSLTTPTFGKNIPTTTTTDPAVLNGWGKRGYNYEYTASVQHELLPRWSLNGDFSHRWYGNQTFTEDTRFTAASYDTFCVTAPADPNLPNGGGSRVCGLEDIKPALAAQNLPANNLITFASNFGGIKNTFTGFNFSTIGRPKQGVYLQVGVGAQKILFDFCNVTNQLGPLGAAVGPLLGTITATAAGTTVYSGSTTATGTEVYADGSRACHQVSPYLLDAKVLGSYTLPWAVILSGTYQHSPGPNILATWNATNAFIAPALGRNLSLGAQAKQISLEEPLAQYGQTLNQLDLRASKRFTIDRVRLRLDADLYNVLNSDWPYTVTTTFSALASSQWLRPTNVLQARLFKIGAQIDF